MKNPSEVMVCSEMVLKESIQPKVRIISSHTVDPTFTHDQESKSVTSTLCERDGYTLPFPPSITGTQLICGHLQCHLCGRRQLVLSSK